jgi:hypothetical protein
MKKNISLYLILSLLLLSFGSNLVSAEEFEVKMIESDQTQESSSTSTALETSENLSAPVIKSMWAMNGLTSDLSGTDDNQDAGAQFLPSGQYQVSKKISVCAIVSDNNGIADIDQILSETYYPMVSFGQDFEDKSLGCGQKKGESCQMTQLPKQDGINLFCDKVQNSNANLPLFYDIYSFSGICGQDGELEKDVAVVYCCEKDLLYNDVAGEYKVSISGKDKQAVNSNTFDGKFNYSELTAFETDFTALDYGNVILNSKKVIEGDLIWNAPKEANHITTRNVGNVRVQMNVEQDDMGLGKTDGSWNIRYGARLGQDSLWQNYWPKEITLLDKILELSGMDKIDFSIEVLKFPEDETKDYLGKMNIDAQRADYQICSSSSEPLTN